MRDGRPPSSPDEHAEPSPPARSPAASLAAVLTFTVGGAGLGLFAYAVCTNSSWLVLGVATVLVVAALGAAMRWERRRDRQLW